MSDLQAMTDALAMLLAKNRAGGHVYMGGEHSPRPSEIRAAEMFINDHVVPLIDPDTVEEDSAITCLATTKKGKPCKSAPMRGEGLCGPHYDQAHGIKR